MKEKKLPKNIAIDKEIKISIAKRVFFYLLIIVISFALLSILEFSFRLAGYGVDLRLFHKSELYPGFIEVNSKVGKRYFTKFEETDPANDIFLMNKPDTCYRIFVMGCSTTRGFPFEQGLMFSRILNYQLQDAFPHKRIEVVNVAMSAVNSFTMVDLIDEILDQKPDAILLYTGHNEYYGAMGVGSVENGGNARWLKLIHLELVRLRTYQFMQHTVLSIVQKFGGNNEPKGTLMARIVKEKSIEINSKLYYEGIDQFRENITDVIEKVQKAHVPIILSELVCNVRDQVPFKSVPDKDGVSAEVLYKKAKESELQGKYNDAKEFYYKAKDLDAIRFRAPEALNDVIHELGEKYKVPVVPMKKYFEDKSPNGLIGNNLMLEHLHPNKNGYFLMANAFLNTMMTNGYINKNWDTVLIKSSDYYMNHWGFTLLDSLVGDLRIKVITAGWPFQPETTVNNFKLTYKPKFYEDSVAFRIISIENTLPEDEHIKLAKHYATMGEPMKAFQEYFSLIKSYPHITDLYFDAEQYLFAAGNYQSALELIFSMPDRDTSFKANMQIAKIYTKLGLYAPATLTFCKAQNYIKNENDKGSVLIGLYNVYKETGNIEKQKETLSEIRLIHPNFGIENTKNNTNKNEKEAIDLVNRSVSFAKHGDFNTSLQLLYASLQKKPTSKAYQMIGAILFKQQDIQALIYYEKAYALDPKDISTVNNLFLLYLMQKNIKSASKILEEYKNISADHAKISKLENLLEKAKKQSNNPTK